MTRAAGGALVAVWCALALALPCTAGAAVTNLGREFWASELENEVRAGSFAIVVVNHDREPAAVTLTAVGEGTTQTATVPARGFHTFTPPRSAVEGTGQGRTGVHRLVADRDVAVHQHNALEPVGSNDASMLLPVSALDQEHRVLGYRDTLHDVGRTGGDSYAQVIATAPGTTTVQVTVAAATRAGGDVPALAAGTTLTRTLDQGEALKLNGVAGADLSGTLVSSDRPVALFSGTRCSFVPAGVFNCDHLEEQTLPVSAWATQLPACRTGVPTGTGRLRVLASEDGTRVSTTPPLTGTPKTLAAGELLDLHVPPGQSVVVDASAPVLVTQYLTGLSVSGIGDPSMSQLVPRAAFRSAYRFRVPGGWTAEQAVVTAPVGTDVSIDGEPVPAQRFHALGDSGLSCATVDLRPGEHEITAEQPVGVQLSGVDAYVPSSYASPAGIGPEPLPCERGAKALRGTPAEGSASRTIKESVVPAVSQLDRDAGAAVESANCDVVAKRVEQGLLDPLGAP